LTNISTSSVNAASLVGCYALAANLIFNCFNCLISMNFYNISGFCLASEFGIWEEGAETFSYLFDLSDLINYFSDLSYLIVLGGLLIPVSLCCVFCIFLGVPNLPGELFGDCCVFIC